MFVYKHVETIGILKISLLFKKNKILRVNNSRILTIKNAKFSGYHFYMNLNIWEVFQSRISVPLRIQIMKIIYFKHYPNVLLFISN